MTFETGKVLEAVEPLHGQFNKLINFDIKVRNGSIKARVGRHMGKEDGCSSSAACVSGVVGCKVLPSAP